MAESSIQPPFPTVDFDPFAGLPLQCVVPITEPQAELWTTCQLGGDDASRAFNESVSLRFSGPLDQSAMERAWQALVSRHEALRSAFSADGRHICIFGEMPTELAYQDCSSQTDAEQQRIVAEWTGQDARHVFDLLNGPLAKASLIKLSDTAHHFTLTAHHIVCDGWSLGILLQDLGLLYSAYDRQTTPVLPEASRFSQYAVEQKEFVAGAPYQKIEQFWLNQYRQTVPVLDLPTDFPRPPLRTYESSRRDYPLDPALVAAVKKMGIQAGCSFVTTLLAAFEVLLHRLTGQNDLVLGLPAAGQSATGHLRLVGHCVNLLPLHSSPRPNAPFIDFLRQRKAALLDAFDHQQLTFGTLLQKLPISRDASRVPLVPVIFNVDMGLDNDVHFAGLDYRLINNPRQYEAVELSVNASGSTDALTLEWSYNTQLFRADTIDRMMGEFASLLRAVTTDPTVLLGQIPLTDQHELRQKIARWNDTTADYPRQTPLHTLIAQTAARYPDKTALMMGSYTSDDVTTPNNSLPPMLTYRTLDETADHVAHHLRSRGVGVGDVVGVGLDRSPELIIALLAVLKSGAAYLPIDPTYPHDRVIFMLTDASAKILLTSNRYKGRLAHPAATELCLDEILTAPAPNETDSADKKATGPATDEPTAGARVSGSDLAYVLYTSGSTGRPKGVPVEHRNLVNLLYSMIDWPSITPDDVLLGVTTVAFDIAGLELFLPLLVGATLVLADAETTKDGRALLRGITEPIPAMPGLGSNRITFMQATPATYKMMLAAGWEPLPDDERPPIKILCCGEPMSKDLAQKLTARCPSVWNMYGPTETTIYSTGKQIRATDEVITIGRPIHNTQVYVLDEERNLLPEGIVGELYIGGAGVARGYLNRPELTAEKFLPDPFDAAGTGRLYRTGDLGKFTADGEIHCLGRIDQQVKIRGYRIELEEIENVLNALPDVREVVVLAREDRPGDQRLVAYVVPETMPELLFQLAPPTQARHWRKQLSTILPAQMIPADFVVMAGLPLTPNGKIARNALLKPPAPTHSELNGTAERIDKVEKQLISIWNDALGLETIGPDDDFFDLGGHSMIAVQVMTRIEREMNRKLPLSTLLTAPTVRQLSALLRSDQPEPKFKSLVPIKPDGSKRPLYIVHGGGLNVLLFNTLAKNMDADQPVYGFQAKGVDGTEDPLETLEEIAAYYVSEILMHNPKGPYALAGYSYGGIIAYEMAHQLRQTGQEVFMLGMIDTYAEQTSRFDSWLTKLTKKSWFLTKSALYTFVLLKENPKLTVSYKSKRLSYYLTRLRWALSPGQKDERIGFYGYPDKIDRLNTFVAENYHLEPYEGRVDVFVAKEKTFYMDDFVFLGWKPYARGGVRTFEIPGTHNTLFDAPNDQEFARVLQAVLDAS